MGVRSLVAMAFLLSGLCLCAQERDANAGRPADVPPVVRSKVGQEAAAKDGSIRLRLSDKRLGYGSGEHFDAAIASPKSISFSADGSKFYVNSLEGCRTVVYDSRTLEKLSVIDYNYTSGQGDLWAPASGFYPFTHYPGGEKRAFRGKPVESTLTPDGSYLFVPFYRRTFDINAQDPSAMAVIDTRTDRVVRLFETGPIPKMVRVSGDGRLLAITHWGDNTVGFLDISSPDLRQWRHLKPVVVDHRHPLNYSLTEVRDRDTGSGYSLRGTLFLPGDSLLLVSGMGGAVAVIDVRRMQWLGWIPALFGVRHIVQGKNRVFFSQSFQGKVLSLPTDSILAAVGRTRQVGQVRQFRVGGLKSVKVGGSVRTIELSPSGRFLFAACNRSSELYVIATGSMEVLAVAPVDSYPVGLDVSPDGSLVVVTSQGRKGFGGNAVNIFAVEYAEPEVVLALPADTTSDSHVGTRPGASALRDQLPSAAVCSWLPWAIGGGVLLILLLAFLLVRRRR